MPALICPRCGWLDDPEGGPLFDHSRPLPPKRCTCHSGGTGQAARFRRANKRAKESITREAKMKARSQAWITRMRQKS